MPDDKISVTLEADSGNLAAGLERAAQSVSTFEKRVNRASKEVAVKTAVMESALASSTQGMRYSLDQAASHYARLNGQIAAGTAGMRRIGPGAAGANQGLLQMAYIMDDLQYGMRGVANNLPILLTSFGGVAARMAGPIGILVSAGMLLKKLAVDPYKERSARQDEIAAEAAKTPEWWQKIMEQRAQERIAAEDKANLIYALQLDQVTRIAAVERNRALMAEERAQDERAAANEYNRRIASAQERAIAEVDLDLARRREMSSTREEIRLRSWREGKFALGKDFSNADLQNLINATKDLEQKAGLAELAAQLVAQQQAAKEAAKAAQEMAQAKAEEAAARKEAVDSIKQEIELERLRAAGLGDAADVLAHQLALRKEAAALAKAAGISEREAQRLVQRRDDAKAAAERAEADRGKERKSRALTAEESLARREAKRIADKARGREESVMDRLARERLEKKVAEERAKAKEKDKTDKSLDKLDELIDGNERLRKVWEKLISQ